MPIERISKNKYTENEITVALAPICKTIPDIQIKGEFLRDTLKKVENTTVINLHGIEMNESQHPTANGTKEMLNQIHATKGIIMPDCESDMISSLRYRGVQTLFKSGCRGCDTLTYTPFLCDDCKENASVVDTLILDEEIRKLTDEMFPPMSGKRSCENNDDNVNDPKKPALDTGSS